MPKVGEARPPRRPRGGSTVLGLGGGGAGSGGGTSSGGGGTGGGGATDLDGLTDVDVSTNPPVDGQGLVWDAETGQWVPGNATGAVPPDTMPIDDLSDVDVSTTPPQDGDGLVWDADAGMWVPGPSSDYREQTGVLTDEGWTNLVVATGPGSHQGRFWFGVSRAGAYYQMVQCEWWVGDLGYTPAERGTTTTGGSWFRTSETVASDVGAYGINPIVLKHDPATDKVSIVVSVVDSQDPEYRLVWDAAEQTPDVVVGVSDHPSQAGTIIADHDLNENITKESHNGGVPTSPESYARHIRHRSQLTGGETLSYVNNCVKWSSDFLVIGVGESPEMSKAYFRMAMPTEGSVIKGAFGHPDVVVGPDGIPLVSWESLYIVPPRTANVADPTEVLRIFEYNNGNGTTVPQDRVPPDWIWLCTRINDGNDVWWGNGGATHHGVPQTYPRQAPIGAPMQIRPIDSNTSVRGITVMGCNDDGQIERFGRFWLHARSTTTADDWQSVLVEWSAATRLADSLTNGTWLRVTPTTHGTAPFPWTDVRMITNVNDQIVIDVLTGGGGNAYEATVTWDPADQSPGVAMVWASTSVQGLDTNAVPITDSVTKEYRDRVLAVPPANGGGRTVSTLAASTVLTDDGNDRLIYATGAITLTLPAASEKLWTVKSIDPTNTVTVVPTTGDYMEGVLNGPRTVGPKASVTLHQLSGMQWWTVA